MKKDINKYSKTNERRKKKYTSIKIQRRKERRKQKNIKNKSTKKERTGTICISKCAKMERKQEKEILYKNKHTKMKE